MKKLLALTAVLLAFTPGIQDIESLLPPDGTPSGWSRSGESAGYTASDVAFITDSPDTFTNNGFVKAIEQKYSNGAKTISLRIFELDDQANATIAFNELAAGKTVTTDIGNGCVLESNMIVFNNANFIIHISSDLADEEISQSIAALALTVDAYLMGSGS